jgi:hypothetical protein
MATTTAANTAKNATKTQELLATFGRSLPERTRVQGTKRTQINIEPTGMSKISHIIDTFEIAGKSDTSKDHLERKKLVLFFGSESHPLTRTFYQPKLAMIYHFLTSKHDNIEFIYVSIDKTREEYNRFTQSHRKFVLVVNICLDSTCTRLCVLIYPHIFSDFCIYL